VCKETPGHEPEFRRSNELRRRGFQLLLVADFDVGGAVKGIDGREMSSLRIIRLWRLPARTSRSTFSRKTVWPIVQSRYRRYHKEPTLGLIAISVSCCHLFSPTIHLRLY
jgi:hypothetical protein